MKSLIGRISITLGMVVFTVNTYAQVDPTLAGAVTVNGALVSGEIDKNNKRQLEIIGINTGIYYNTQKIKEMEETTYKYLSQAQSIVSNAYDVARSATLMESIYSNLRKCSAEVKNHPQGMVVSLIVSKKYTQIVTESSSLYSYIASLVTKSGEKNLLNSAERNQIMTEVVNRLSMINRDLTSLRYQIQYLRWMDIPRYIAPGEYYKAVSSKLIVDGIKRDIDRMSRR